MEIDLRLYQLEMAVLEWGLEALAALMALATLGVPATDAGVVGGVQVGRSAHFAEVGRLGSLVAGTAVIVLVVWAVAETHCSVVAEQLATKLLASETFGKSQGLLVSLSNHD